jgi:bacillithiol biosynthesis deacetylase BshB1
MKLDVLAIGAHPDDVELGVAGTLISLVSKGYKVAILDLTDALLSTRGDQSTRQNEACLAAEIMCVTQRIQLGAREGSLLSRPENLYQLVSVIRQTQPGLILAPYWEDRHPDHADASRLTQNAVFWAGVAKFGDNRPPHRPQRTAHYFCHWEGSVSFVVDISEFFDRKLEAVQAYKSQFAVEPGENPTTYISQPVFLEKMISRARYYGSLIGADYGEPFVVREMNRVVDPVAWSLDQGLVG